MNFDEFSDVEEVFEHFGITTEDYLGAGRTRATYAAAEFVLKVAGVHWVDPNSEQAGKEAIRKEVDRYQQLDDKDVIKFARPIIWAFDYSWAIYERAEKIGQFDNFQWKQLLELAYRHRIWDMIPENAGWRKGVPIIIDYAE
jgi:hypothetical protein